MLSIATALRGSSDAHLEHREDGVVDALDGRDQVMAILGHDLRTPLNVVLLMTDLLLDRTELPDPARRRVETIDRAARRMLAIVRSLVDFADVRFAPDPRVGVLCDLHDICRNAVDELRALHPGRTVELALGGDGRGTWDPVRMGQVVSNLVGNALQHGDPGDPVQVSVSGDDAVVVGVHNRGPSIAPARLAEIFEPFRTGSSRRDGSHARGLGLGLYIVKAIAEAHGGTVAVRSSDEHGTTFTVTLPRPSVSGARPGSTAPRASAG